MTAPFGAASVTAYPVDVNVGGTMEYDLVYVDTIATPDRYDSGLFTVALDGTSSAKRPSAIDGTWYMAKQ